MAKEIICKPKVYAPSVGKQLEKIRLSKSLSVEQVAELAGIRPATVLSLENGRYNFGVEQLGAVAKALDCEIKITPNQ